MHSFSKAPFGALALCLWLLAHGEAAAQAPARLLWVPLRTVGPVPDISTLEALIQDELRTRDEVLQVVNPTATPTGADAKALAAAAKALERGKALLAELSFDAAVQALERAIALESQVPAWADADALIDAHVSIAVAEFRRGNEQAANAALLDALRLRPKHKLAQRFPPAFMSAFEAVRERLSRAPTGQVRVDGPPGASVFVDGRSVGPAPASVSGLAYGAHLVRVHSASGERFGQKVQVGKGIVQVRADLPMGAAPAIPPRLTPVELRTFSALATQNAAAFVLSGVVATTNANETVEVQPVVYSAARDAFALLPKLSLPGNMSRANVAALRLVDDLVASTNAFPTPTALPVDLTPVAVVAVPPPNVAAGGKKVERASGGVPWWVWAGAGVLVLGAAGGTAYYVASQPAVTGTVNVTW
jgi:tetratricopeptide (TPR) repeat protein